jgi:hypothetical protein
MINLPIIYRFFRIIYRFWSIGRTENLPIIYRFFPVIYRCSRAYSTKNRLKIGRRNPGIDRRVGSIHRSGSRDRGVESSGNRQIASSVDRPVKFSNRKGIVKRVPGIVNSAAWNLSTIHHQNGEIYHLGRRERTVQLPESSDNQPTIRESHRVMSGCMV